MRKAYLEHILAIHLQQVQIDDFNHDLSLKTGRFVGVSTLVQEHQCEFKDSTPHQQSHSTPLMQTISIIFHIRLLFSFTFHFIFSLSPFPVIFHTCYICFSHFRASFLCVHVCILQPFSTSIHSLTLFTPFFPLNIPSPTNFSSIIHMKQPQTLFLISICRTNLFDILPYKLISHTSLVSVFFLLSSPHTVKRNKLSAANSAMQHTSPIIHCVKA